MRRCIVALSFLLAALNHAAWASTADFTPGITMSAEELAALPRSEDGSVAYAGDVILYLDRVGALGAISGTRWVRGELVYQFNGQDATQQGLFREACQAWTQGTALRCVERTSQTNFVSVITHTGNGCGGFANVSCSAVGMIGGSQRMEIYTGHWSVFTRHVIEHEIGHALGLIHEQSRPDRDRYVIINWGNVRSGASHNFAIDPAAEALTEYDYSSLMHYNNCAFSTRTPCNPADRATEPNWTISPAPCALDRVGGVEITALDLDGIRKAYGGPVAALFATERLNSCGSHTYSKSQVEAACGTGCAAAGPVGWNRIFVEYDWGCGFMTPRDGPRFCASRKQEFIRQWWDKDDSHIKCWGGTLQERWTQCGCSVQALTALCTNYESEISMEKLRGLIQSSDPHTRQTGLLVDRLLSYSERGYFSQSLVDVMTEVMLAAYVRGDHVATNGFLCQLRAELTVRRLIDPNYKMSRDRFMRMARIFDIV